ncbi:MAG: hypothetical protein LBR52_04755 [Prevotellaceae bacterium]|jgi:hypothetical protein|nr:hypothetical protein [Prevotellaceae bacterium]
MTTQEIQDAIKARFGAQLEEWKKLHGAIKGYGSDGKIAVFRVADINTIDTCRMMSRGSTLKFSLNLVENCWLGGDEELIKEDRYRLDIADWGNELIEVVAGEMVEL